MVCSIVGFLIRQQLVLKYRTRVLSMKYPVYDIYTVYAHGLLTKGEVKITGYWPSSFCGVFIDLNEVEINKKAETNEPIFSHFDRRVGQ